MEGTDYCYAGGTEPGAGVSPTNPPFGSFTAFFKGDIMVQWSSAHENAFQTTMTSANASSAVPVKVKTADRKMYITTIVISVATAMSVQLQDDTGTPVVLMEQMYFGTNGGAVIKFDEHAPLIVNTNKDLDVLASTSGNLSVSVFGYLDI